MPITMFTAKQNDANVPIAGFAMGGATYDATGAVVTPAAPVSLTGATLKLQCRQFGTTTPVINGTATADSDQTANKGKWSYVFTAGDLANPAGLYRMTLQASWGDGHIETFPSHGYDTLEIEEEVA